MPRPPKKSASAPRSATDTPALRQLVGELADTARADVLGASPIVPIDEREGPERLAALDALGAHAVVLERRGQWHGEWAELDPTRLSRRPTDSTTKRWSSGLEPHAAAVRWLDARPIVLRGAVRARLDEFAAEIEHRAALHATLSEGRGLRDFTRAAIAPTEGRFALPSRPASLFDADRDLERVLVASRPPVGVRGRRVDDLWLKTSWLSTFDGEDSLRLRVSFGREKEDDAARDLLRHRLVAELAELCFPESALVADDPVIVPFLERCTRTRVLFTQHIAYWNSPGGGALFHHDAFAEDTEPGLGPGQLGVCYVQLSGRTAWLALSTDELVLRVREFGAALAAGELPWVRAQLFERPAELRRFETLLADHEALVNELALPGCGFLATLVNRGPEFTHFLAAHGHGALLGPGDVILLPNHGLARTCMHSVFCAGDERAFSLSLAIRSDEEAE